MQQQLGLRIVDAGERGRTRAGEALGQRGLVIGRRHRPSGHKKPGGSGPTAPGALVMMEFI